MPAHFDLFLPIVLKHEGGYVNRPDDPGGETNLGVTMLTFRGCAKKLLGIEPTSENLKALTADQAGAIYRELYWNRLHCDEFPTQDLANIVCDFYVNAGRPAPRLLQRILGEHGWPVTLDGVIGPATIGALKTCDQKAIYNAYRQGRISYYQALGERMPQFLKGWLARVNSFPEL